MPTYSTCPLVSANLYASGFLEAGINKVIRPIADQAQAMGGFVWIMRYHKRGEHLKIRIHADERYRTALRDLLSRVSTDFLRELANVPEPVGGRKIGLSKLPSIDREDEIQEVAPDRSLLLTTWRRCHVPFADNPWLKDDDYISLACHSYGAGCGLYIDRFSPLGATPEALTLLARCIIAITPDFGMSELELQSYHAYHRDWLLRFFLRDSQQNITRNKFEDALRQNSALTRGFRWLTSSERSLPANAEWIRSAAELLAYVRKASSESPAYDIDPFASRHDFPPLFKLLHALANQMGVAPLKEAYVHHLLMHGISRVRELYAA